MDPSDTSPTDPPESPRYELALPRLEAVGAEWNGEYVPAGTISYAPVGGWR